MLKSTKIILKRAQKSKYAVGAFNTCNLEITKAIFRACEKMKSPLIIQTSESEAAHGEISKLAVLILEYINNAKIPASLHLDHGKSFKFAKKCIDAGYNSVMFDGSKLSLKDNIKITKKITEYAHQRGIPVEGELGIVPTPAKNEKAVISKKETEKLMTDPDEAQEFVNKTNIDSLAVGIGNAHGLYKGKPKISFERLKQIKKMVNIPLVLHGGSGIKPAEIKRAISLGICKINVNTELRVAFSNTLREALKNKDAYVPYKIMTPVENAIEKILIKKIKLFGCANKAI